MATKKEDKTVTASLTVNFEKPDSEGDGFLSWEVDDRAEEDGGLNLGDTSFAPGDTAWLLLFQESNVTLTDAPFTSGGTLTKEKSLSEGEVDFTGVNAEYITVANSNTANLSKPANVNAPSLSWLGKTKKVGKGTQKLEMMKNEDGSTSEVIIDVGTEMVGVIKAEYKSKGQPYKLDNVPKEYPAVVVFAIGTRA